MLRKFPRPIKRIVIKLGSSMIASYRLRPRISHLQALVKQIAALRAQGVDVIVVSSGAIVLGMGELGLRVRPHDLPSLQGLAATGQTILMQTYVKLFRKFKVHCAQVLLTWDDFDARQRYNNARNTFNAILGQGVVPIVNENDTISTEEIKFGDNDRLSAFVACCAQADLLLVLSDVEGFYDLQAGKKNIFSEIREITKEIESLAGGTTNAQLAKGGMSTKLEAVKMATRAKIPCIIAHGETRDILTRVIAGERIGTFFVEREEKLLARKHWISFGAKPRGILVVDDGAKEALLKGGKSLLLPGLIRWEGHFKKEDVVRVVDKDLHEIARGIVDYSSAELQGIPPLERKGKKEVIHRNDLVLSER